MHSIDILSKFLIETCLLVWCEYTVAVSLTYVLTDRLIVCHEKT